MSVERFDPRAITPGLNAAVVAELLVAAERSGEDNFGLLDERITELARVARQDGGSDWVAVAETLEDADLEKLIRLFTVAERLPGWEAGAKSPVIPLARQLKKRGRYPEALTAWIKSQTDNRFLPYGSLMDRL